MAGYLTTHVLDTARGTPASELLIRLFRIEDGAKRQLAEMTTNDDGRTDSPILPEDRFETGTYELVFMAGAYLRSQPGSQDGLPFLDDIPIRFRMEDPDAHYHVPLLLSPYGYSTYRGS
ncbi:hydroxyisourate hydrolase [Notoacmeibacter ruber]|uniref:5-hydroxyisourate hydrolase n=1 Tax=Notoacmeibacter ruber TaxID=2670375 RepID=A0A3L7JID2_9HYPH|nr:hydroxyisourate hydrolase [Notoacmeibacter ruber]RLQ88242.1 hydroxyisourate hydrolase [Notoacmeibacter ruber]